MRCIIELPNGQWLARSVPGHLSGTDETADAKVFDTPEQARAYARHLGLTKYDVWSVDGETWIEDRYYVQGVGLTDGEDLTQPINPLTKQGRAVCPQCGPTTLCPHGYSDLA